MYTLTGAHPGLPLTSLVAVFFRCHLFPDSPSILRNDPDGSSGSKTDLVKFGHGISPATLASTHTRTTSIPRCTMARGSR